MRLVPVLIAGGGPVGMTLACELSRRGIECMLVECNSTTTRYPKMDIRAFRGKRTKTEYRARRQPANQYRVRSFLCSPLLGNPGMVPCAGAFLLGSVYCEAPHQKSSEPQKGP